MKELTIAKRHSEKEDKWIQRNRMRLPCPLFTLKRRKSLTTHRLAGIQADRNRAQDQQEK